MSVARQRSTSNSLIPVPLESEIRELGTAKPLSMLPSSSNAMDSLFIGRSEDMKSLQRELLAPSSHLVSVVGPAGVGKTRLVREFLELLDQDTSGIFVSLVELTNAEDVADRIAAACGVTPIGRDDLGRLSRRLESRDQDIVIVLDNAEHVREEVADIALRLARIENVFVLVTSREPLGLSREEVHRLQVLSRNDGASLLQALAQRRGISVSNDEANELADALDGLPLAIELAAERTTILSPSQIKTRLRESNRVLASAHEDRHASLNIALGHSWAHLGEAERELCTRLALFDHALTPDMIEDLWPDVDVLTLGQSLVAKSWLTVLDDGKLRRWQMLRAVRAFVLDRTQNVERVAVHDRLVEWVERNLDKDRYWWAPRAEEALAAMAILRERGNYQLAGEALLRLFWGGTYGFRTRAIFREALAIMRELEVDGNAALHCELGIRISKLSMLYSYGQSPTEWAEKALEQAPDNTYKIMAQIQLARGLLDENRREEALETAQEAFSLLDAIKLGPEFRHETVSWMIDFSTLFHASGLRERAIETTSAAYKLAHGEPILQARTACHLAILHLDAGEFSACAEDISRARRLLVDASHNERFICLNVFPAWLHIARGEYDEARQYLDDALGVAEDTGNRGLHYFCDRAFADLAMAQGKEARPYIEHALHKLALVDNNQSAINETTILLSLNLIYRGAFAEAKKKILSIIDAGQSQLHGDPQACISMLHAAVRFCEARLGNPSKERADTPFAKVVDAAVAALKDGGNEDLFEADLARTDLRDLIVPGFFFLRFELHVRAWLRKELVRSQQSLMRIEHDGRHFTLDGKTYNFSRKAALRRMLVFLAQRATTQPDEAVDVHEVIRATWPDQIIEHEAALNRAYTTINRLRTTAGMGDHLESRDDGYLIKPALRIEWVDEIS